MINVMIAFSNALFSEGVKKILEEPDEAGDIRVTGIYRREDPAYCPDPDVTLVDIISLYNVLTDGVKGELILLDTGCGAENAVSAIVKKGVKGVLTAESGAPLLKKAIRAVAMGEMWLDKGTVKNVMAGIRAWRKKTGPAPLSERELEIVALVGQGYRNREIARKLLLSEPTVKSHLHNIFQKLDIRNRPQLITFALKNGAMDAVGGWALNG